MTAHSEIQQRHWRRIARHYRAGEALPAFSCGYRRWLAMYLRHILPADGKLLELGCGNGYLLNLLPVRERTGVDLVAEQVAAARELCPGAEFHQGVAEDFQSEEPFDYILLSDTLNEAADVQAVLENALRLGHEDTRLVINVYNSLWRPVLAVAYWFGLKPARPELNWLTRADLLNLLGLSGWELVKHESRILVPHEMWGIGSLINRWLAPLVPWLCLSQFFVVRKRRRLVLSQDQQPTASVIIPARNERGNIRAAIERLPQMGSAMEIIFVEGNSSDGTWEAIQEAIAAFPERTIRAYQQPGKGKGDAMRTGYAHATGDILLILDADLTVPPEDLPKFFLAVAGGSADFANGVRMIYPMEEEAMRFLNMCGNKFFSWLFSWLLGQRIKDTLCGTKVFRRADYFRIEANRSYFGDFDPFGDFDLIFGAARLNLKIRDIPVRYQSRTYGETQISRWRDGWLLIRMCAFAARKLKFLR